jgi:transposase
MAAEELEDLHRLDAKLKSMKAELKTAVLATGSHLMDIHGIGPAGAARILADVARFPDRNHFASWTGTAPIDASSGQHLRHRLSRAGNRRPATCSISPASSSSATTPPAGRITGASSPRARPRWKRCAACAGACPTRSTGSWQPTLPVRMKRAREGTPGRL